MTIVVRYRDPAIGVEASRPHLNWTSGFELTRHWTSDSLPDSGPLGSWISSITAPSGGNVLNSSTPTTNPVIKKEGSHKYASFDTSNTIFRVMGFDPATTRTVIVFGRTDTDDKYVGTSKLAPAIFRASGDFTQSLDSDNVQLQAANPPTLPAPRGKWHMYAVSQPANSKGWFFVDGKALEQDISGRAITDLWIGRSVDPNLPSAENARQRSFKVLEILTTSKALNPQELFSVFVKAKAAFPELNWAETPQAPKAIYTLQSGDRKLDFDEPTVVTIPAGVSIRKGSKVTISGDDVEVQPEEGVNLDSPSTSVSGQAELKRLDLDSYILTGDLSVEAVE